MKNINSQFPLEVEINLSCLGLNESRRHFAVVTQSLYDLEIDSLEAIVTLRDPMTRRPLLSREFCLVEKSKVIRAYDETKTAGQEGS